MTIGTKSFAKKVACAPETVGPADFAGCASFLAPDEKVHIVLLAAEARRQAALLHGLAAIMKHMSGEGADGGGGDGGGDGGAAGGEP